MTDNNLTPPVPEFDPLEVPKQKLWDANPLGMASFFLMILGVVTSIVPFLGIIAFFALPVSFVLGIASLVKRRTPKWPAWLGIIGSVITTSVNIVVLIFYITVLFAAAVAAFSGLTS